MPVYLIRAGENGPVKIGRASDPAQRLSDLQTAHWETLRLIRVWEGDAAEESALHLQFADLRIRGEWFGFSRSMLSDVSLPVIGEEQTFGHTAWIGRPSRFPSILRALMEKSGLSDPDLARLAGTSKQQIFKLRTGQRSVSVEWAKILAPHLGVSWQDLFSDDTEVA